MQEPEPAGVSRLLPCAENDPHLAQMVQEARVLVPDERRVRGVQHLEDAVGLRVEISPALPQDGLGDGGYGHTASWTRAAAGWTR